MGKDYILVIDEGTTGTRAILFDKKFQIAEQSYEEFCQPTPAENMVEHDAEEIYDLSVKMCKNVIEKKGNLSRKYYWYRYYKSEKYGSNLG